MPLTSAEPKSHPGAAAALNSIAEPIAFMRQEHDRQCQICDQLEDLFNNEDKAFRLASAESIRAFLLNDLSHHIEDEELDLFPLLVQRCKSHESLEDILSQLASEHELDKEFISMILLELDAVIEQGAAENPMRFLMNARAFAETQRRHLYWENRVVLPLAERHLTEQDKMMMSRNMLARRAKARVG